MSARATEIWRVDSETGGVVGIDDKGNEFEIAYVDDPDHARWIAKVPQLIEIVRKLKDVIDVEMGDGRVVKILVLEELGIEGVAELLAEIDGKWPGEEVGG